MKPNACPEITSTTHHTSSFGAALLKRSALVAMRRLIMSRRRLRLAWMLLLAFQVLCIVFLLFLASVYVVPWYPNSFLGYIAINVLFSKQQRFLADYHVLIAAAYMILSLPFVYGVVTMLWHSFGNAQLAFGSLRRRVEPDTMVINHSRRRWLCNLKGDFELGEARYTAYLLFAESVEVAIQTVQAHQNSKYLSNMYINQAYAVVILINCWSTPLIHYYWEIKQHNRLLAHLVSVLVDAVLDFTWGTVLQGLMYARYWQVYQEMSAPWVLNPEGVTRELQQLLVVSVSNFVFSVFPFVSSARVLVKVRSVLNEAEVVERVVPTQGLQLVHVSPKTEPTQTFVPNQNRSQGYTFVVMILMVVHGFAIACVSLMATGVFWSEAPSTIACQNQLHPWFTASTICVGRSVDCSTLDISGSERELAGVLGNITTYLLARLELVGCVNLELPTILHGFADISTLRIVNSNITSWTTDASLTDPYFPLLQTLMIWDTTFACIPYGSILDPLPQSFEWIDMRNVNADLWIPLVQDSWCSIIYFTCNYCGLREFPRAISCMKDLMIFELQSNAFNEIPDGAFGQMAAMQYFVIIGNPVTSLPPSVWGLVTHIYEMDIQATNVSYIPANLATMVSHGFKLHAFRTPLCGNSSSEFPWVVCADDIAEWA